jgi:pyruvate,water dikinase
MGAMNGFLGWAEAYAAGPDACGGKGWNLARLARYGFRVPRGGVLPVGAALSGIREGMERLGLAGAKVAVRSSATAEDGVRASFAGIHRSFLNVSGVPAIERAAQGCLDSLATPEAVAYRRRMGFRDEEVRCAVVVCEMVEARCAGVAFSCDPATGRRDLVAIEAAEGLGDAVLGGRVNPRRAVWRSRTGILRREESSESTPLPAATEEELAYQARRAQWALGGGQDPQDIEWAYDGRQLWLLQARPVTGLPRAGWPATARMPRYWSTANLKDNQPYGWCEFSWSALDEVVADVLFSALTAVGYPVPPGMEAIRRFHGRGFFDLTAMQYGFYDAFGILPAQLVNTIGGQQPEIDVPSEPYRGAAGRRRRWAGLRLLRLVWNVAQRARPAVRRQMEEQRRLSATDFRRCSLAEIEEVFREIAGLQETLIQTVGLANAASGPWKMELEAAIEDRGLVDRLQAGSGAVASAEHGYRLYEIACGESTVEAFLREFGHRAVYETDARNPRWVEDPAWVLEQVEAIRANPPARDLREAAAEVRREAEGEVRRRFPWRAPMLLWFARKLREAVAAREECKSAMVAAMLPARLAMLEVGLRLVASGQLDAPEQMFELSAADLTCLLRGWWDGAGARELTGDRTRRQEAWLAEDCPDAIVESADGAMEARQPDVSERAAVDGVWSGIAVSPGAAEGPARLVRHPEDAAHLQQGDVLCAPSTDPGWTPLFLRASAIVMETGGYLSHGSIVAREYGIPAVANVPGILGALRDGERVLVDGSKGTIVTDPRARR